jgi:hypothetical protein
MQSSRLTGLDLQFSQQYLDELDLSCARASRHVLSFSTT